MKKTMIAAAFGGVLAASCWVTAAPANAGPCEANGYNGAACAACMRNFPNAFYPNCESSVPPPGQRPLQGTWQACQQSGSICTPTSGYRTTKPLDPCIQLQGVRVCPGPQQQSPDPTQGDGYSADNPMGNPNAVVKSGDTPPVSTPLSDLQASVCVAGDNQCASLVAANPSHYGWQPPGHRNTYIRNQ